METIQEVLQDIESLRYIPNGGECICLFSGDKDSVLALAMAIEQGAWHKQSDKIAKNQALELGMRINAVPAGVFQNKTQFIRLLKEYKNKGVEYVVCGDVLEGDQSLLEITYCLTAGLRPVMPLWKRTNTEILQLVEKHRIEAIITYIEDEKQIDEKWLGKKYDRVFFEELKRIQVDEIGEDGEFHSTVVDACIFNKRLDFTFGKVEYTNQGVKIPLIV